MKVQTRYSLLFAVALISGRMAGTGEAAPGEGLYVGPCILRPYAELAGTYDSNANQAPDNREPDTFVDSCIGLKCGYSAYMLDLDGHGFAGARNYSELTDKDFTSWGEVLRLKYGARDTLALEVDQSFRKVEDFDRLLSEATIGGVSPNSVLDAGARTRRDVNEVGFLAGRDVTDKLGLDIGYRFTGIRYEAADLYNLESHVAQAELMRRATEKTDAVITTIYGRQITSAGSDDANYYAVRAGIKTRGTDKTTLKAGCGAMQFDGPAGMGQETFFHYEGSAIHRATDRLSFQLGGRNGVVLSSLYSGNGVEFDTVWVGAAYRPTEDLAISANVTWREDDYLNPVLVGNDPKDRSDHGLALRLRADWLTPLKCARLYAEGTYETVDSTVVDSYDETRLTVGMSVQY